MIIALIAVVAVAAFFAGIAAHQRVSLREARFELSACRDEEVRQAEVVGDLRARIAGYETGLTEILGWAK